MSDGMKAGSADDPFADDEDADSSGQITDGEPNDTTTDGPFSDSTEQVSTASARSYVDRRDGAKDERRLVQFFLRDDVYSETAEDRLRLNVTENLGEKPGKFDLREALVAVGAKHDDEVVDELEEMGY